MSEVKKKVVHVRLSESAYRRLVDAADAAGLSVVDIIRIRALAPDMQIEEIEKELTKRARPKRYIERRDYPKADPQLIRQLALIGNNLNQIARQVNSLGVSDALELLQALKRIERRLLQVLKDAS